MISQHYDRRTLANMEIALERACAVLSTGSDKHRARRHIASRIIRCAESGNRTLGGLTAAAIAAAQELRPRRPRRPPHATTPAPATSGGRKTPPAPRWPIGFPHSGRGPPPLRLLSGKH